MNKWSEEAIEAAWEAFWGGHHQIEKADMAAALNAALEAERQYTSRIMNERLRQKIEELECRKD
jgi:hypothetical protein